MKTPIQELLETLKRGHHCGGEGLCWIDDEAREAAEVIERMQTALRGTLHVIDQVAPKQPPEMQQGFKTWRDKIVAALGES